MEEYISRLDSLSANFSYEEFCQLLQEVDNDILNGKITTLNSDFLSSFNHMWTKCSSTNF